MRAKSNLIHRKYYDLLRYPSFTRPEHERHILNNKVKIAMCFGQGNGIVTLTTASMDNSGFAQRFPVIAVGDE